MYMPLQLPLQITLVIVIHVPRCEGEKVRFFFFFFFFFFRGVAVLAGRFKELPMCSMILLLVISVIECFRNMGGCVQGDPYVSFKEPPHSTLFLLQDPCR